MSQTELAYVRSPEFSALFVIKKKIKSQRNESLNSR